MTNPQYARADYAGLIRCCIGSIPVDLDNYVIAGTEGEHRPCQYHEDGGVTFRDGVWIAAWIADKEKAG